MSKEFLKISGVSKAFGGVQALQDIDLTIYEGETRCLAGGNGGGKSTLIKIISGYYTPDSGTITINGKEYSKLTPQISMAEGIQIIYQDFSVFPNLTVAENIAMLYKKSEKTKFINWKSIREKAQEGLNLINAKIDLDAKVEDLSVADKQLVAIARAILLNAKLLIMDEPTTALTKNEVDALFNVVRDLQKKGISIVFVSHKLEEVFEICDKLTILRNGKKVMEGNMSDVDRKKFIYYMTGRDIKDTQFLGPKEFKNPLLEVNNLYKKNVLNKVSFKLFPGEVLGVTGLLGSGRSELAESLFGLEKVDSGEIFIKGSKVEIKNVSDAINNKIAYVPEDRLTEGLFLPHSVAKNTVASVIDSYTNKNGIINEEKIDEDVEKWIKELKVVTPNGSLPVQLLSGGNQQKVVIAKWLATNPDILILNSPTVGIDVGAKADIHKIAKQMAERGLGVIIISDDISEVLQNCNRVLIMKKGKIVSEHKSIDLTEQELAVKLAEV